MEIYRYALTNARQAIALMIVCLVSTFWTLLPNTATAEIYPKIAIFHFYPFGSLKGDSAVSGLFYDLARAVEEESGVALDYKVAPISRSIRTFARGEADLIITNSSSNMITAHPSLGVFGCHRTVLLTRKGSDIGALEEVRGKPIGYVTNALLFKKFGGLHGEKIVQVSSSKSLFLMLVHDRLDGFFVSDIVLDAYIKDGIPIAGLPTNWRDKLGPVVLLDSAEVHLRMNRATADEDIAARLKTAITALKTSREFEKIYLRYGSTTRGSCP